MPWNQVMHKWGQGTLKSGGSGKPVTSQKQAVAIMYSEKRAAAHGKTEYAAKPMHPAMHRHAKMISEAHAHLATAIPHFNKLPGRQRMMAAQEYVRTRKANGY